MERLFKLLYKIRENPALCFGGRENVSLLKAYIGGYLAKEWEIDENYRGTFALNGFQEFVQKKYNIISSQSWDRIIDFYSTSDKEAFEKFYKLLDEFLGSKKDLYVSSCQRDDNPLQNT